MLHNPYDKSSSVLVANSAFHMKFPEDMLPEFHRFTSSLIYFSSMRISNKSEDQVPVISNPRTRQYVSLPKLRSDRKSYSVLGFDPIDKQLKVLALADTCSNKMGDYRILTLGIGELRSEKFKFIGSELFYCRHSNKLINYKGKLGIIEDAEKPEWSKNVYTLGENAPVNPSNHFIVGVTATGEIVISQRQTSERFYVFYFSPKRNTLQRVEIQGVENHCEVNAFVDHVEDLNVTMQ
ncbi:hypothetical protein EUTSA_v10028042mg, partial [Eutrema salsugineum]